MDLFRRASCVLQPKASSLSVSRLKNWDLGFWNTDPTFRASWCMGVLAGSRPSTSTRPSRRQPGVKAGIRPLMSLVTVVFPQPEAPHSRTHSPGRMAAFRPARVSREPS